MFGKDSVKKFRINTKKERDVLKNKNKLLLFFIRIILV